MYDIKTSLLNAAMLTGLLMVGVAPALAQTSPTDNTAPMNSSNGTINGSSYGAPTVSSPAQGGMSSGSINQSNMAAMQNTYEPGNPDMAHFFSADRLYPASLTSRVDYTVLADEPFTYDDLYRAKAIGLTPGQTVRAVAVAYWSNTPMRDILERLQTGATFLELAAQYNIPPGWVMPHGKAEEFKDRVVKYIVAYETTGKDRRLAMNGQEPNTVEQVSPYYEEFDSSSIPQGGVQPIPPDQRQSEMPYNTGGTPMASPNGMQGGGTQNNFGGAVNGNAPSMGQQPASGMNNPNMGQSGTGTGSNVYGNGTMTPGAAAPVTGPGAADNGTGTANPGASTAPGGTSPAPMGTTPDNSGNTNAPSLGPTNPGASTAPGGANPAPTAPGATDNGAGTQSPTSTSPNGMTPTPDTTAPGMSTTPGASTNGAGSGIGTGNGMGTTSPSGIGTGAGSPSTGAGTGPSGAAGVGGASGTGTAAP